MLINGVRIDMEVDTGASASIISEDTYREIAAHSAMEPLQESTLKLTTYTGESISLAGSTSVAVRCMVTGRKPLYYMWWQGLAQV